MNSAFSVASSVCNMLCSLYHTHEFKLFGNNTPVCNLPKNFCCLQLKFTIRVTCTVCMKELIHCAVLIMTYSFNSLGFNEIRDLGATALANALQVNKSLTTLK